MNANEVPPDLKNAKEHLNTLDDIINAYGTSRLEVAVHFVYNHPGIDYLVFGVDSKEQLLQNIAVVKNKKNLDACVKEIRNSFSKIEESIIFPSLWKKA
jgi:aryl-alcohol dehydrogenase-like predicted oxidoreductase